MSASHYLTVSCAALMLVACGASETADSPMPETPDASAETVTETAETSAPSETEAEATTPGVVELADAVAGSWREEGRSARDGARNPQATLEFMGVDPSGSIIEISPGGGWYTDILAPWFAGNGGTYIAAHFQATSDYRRQSLEGFRQRYADTSLFGTLDIVEFGDTSGPLADANSVDAIVSFRNVHNWMGGNYAEKAFDDFFAALRPGGTLGVVEHRLPSTREQDPRASSGYVTQDYVIALAEEAGFEFVESSEVNANPADTADHPFGVWTLPPVRRSQARGEPVNPDFDHAPYDAIGESDRMTLVFRKPESSD